MESDQSSQGSSSTGIELGFLKNIDHEDFWRLYRCYFPSKLGGKPAWLDPKNLPSTEELKCPSCGKPTIFLLQIYAPNENLDDAFHRTIFLFCCKTPSCYSTNSNGPFRVFRCQLKKENAFYSSEPPDYDSRTFSQSCMSYENLCNICGNKGDKLCSKCKLVAYCSREHQVLGWKSHKVKCGNLGSDSDGENESSLKLLYPENEIIIEAEGILDDLDDIKENGVNEDYESENVSQNRSFSPRELEQFADYSIEDNQFAVFRKTISNSSDQILRYDKGGQPLWCSDENKMLSEKVPKCENCGSVRQFEFQIMPQLLNHLNLESSLDGPCIDWGILAIYTCSNDCVSESISYIPDYIHKQDFSHNVGD
ncbi:programmed cell death protein 2-like [Styela clava]